MKRLINENKSDIPVKRSHNEKEREHLVVITLNISSKYIKHQRVET